MPAPRRSPIPPSATSSSLERWRVEVSFDPARLLALESALTPAEQRELSDAELGTSLQRLAEENPAFFMKQPVAALPTRLRPLLSESHYALAWEALSRGHLLKEALGLLPRAGETPHLPIKSIIESWERFTRRNLSEAIDLWKVLPEVVRSRIPLEVLDRVWVDSARAGTSLLESYAVPGLSGRVSLSALVEGWRITAETRPDIAYRNWQQAPARLKAEITTKELRVLWERTAEMNAHVALSWVKDAPFEISEEEKERVMKRWALQYPKGVLAHASGDSSYRDMPEIPAGIRGYAWQQLVKVENEEVLRNLDSLNPAVRDELTPEILRGAWLWYGRSRPKDALMLYKTWPADARTAISPEDLAEVWGVQAERNLETALERLQKLPKAARAVADLTRLIPAWNEARKGSAHSADRLFQQMPPEVVEAMPAEGLAEFWRQLASQMPYAAAKTFPQLSATAIAFLSPEDLAPLMKSESSEVRTQGILFMGRLGGAIPEARTQERAATPPSQGRERGTPQR